MNAVLDTDIGQTLLREHLADRTDAPWRVTRLNPPDAPRRVLAYTPGASPGAPQYVGKYYDDASGEHAYRAMQFVRTALLKQDAACTLATPAALLYSGEQQFLGQSMAPGVLYSDLISSEHFDRFLRQAGCALADLHALPTAAAARFCRLSSVDDHLVDLIHPHPLVLAEREPEFRAPIEALLAAIRTRAHDGFTPAPLHRDFHLRQMFHTPGKTWLIDWDLFGLGDPALDVGNFTVYLRTHLLQAAAPSAMQAFLSGYFDKCGDCGALLARVPVYQALTYLRMACKHYRLQQVSWREKTRRYLMESAACFDKRERVFEGV
jgi:aminoglycoside phosphotransferase (APT) family kinase protein